MDRNKTPDETLVTDAEIEEIVAQGEPGIDALMSIYEPIESTYMAATGPAPTSVSYSSNTTS